MSAEVGGVAEEPAMTPPVILCRAGVWLVLTARDKVRGLADLRAMLRDVEAAIKEMAP